MSNPLLDALAGSINSCPAVGTCPKAPVAPTVSIAAPKIVLVKKSYQKDPHRIELHLGTTGGFTGMGALTCSVAAKVKIFKSLRGGVAVPLPYAIAGGTLSGGLTLYVEGTAASAAMDDVAFSLILTPGGEPLKDNPAKDACTCVEVAVDLGQYKPTPGGADPALLGGDTRIGTGRTLHLQDDRRYAGRCLMVVAQVKPTSYPGTVVVRAQNNRVRCFLYGDEVPAAGQTVLADPLVIANAAVRASGLKLWVEGAAMSAALRDTGFTVEIGDLPRREGDRANITVVKAELQLFKSKKTAAAAPEQLSGEDKFKVGRCVHIQDGSRKRAMLVVRKVQPAAFSGNLVLACWHVTLAPKTAAKAATPRIELFDAATAGATVAFGTDIPQAAAAPDNLKTLWVQGKSLSNELVDTQVRVGVKDAEGSCDCVSITVFKVSKVDVTLRGTPCKREAARINAMPAGAAKTAALSADSMRANTMAAKTITKDSKTIDATAITVVRECGPLKMAATVSPATVKLTWDIEQAADDAVKGGTPTHADDGSDKKRKVTADKTGSFHVFAFVDSNGDAKHNEDEDGVTVNVNMVELKVPVGAANNRILKAPAYNNARSSAGALVVDSGPIQTAPVAGYRDAAFANYPIAFKVTVTLAGGGADGLRGVSKVTLGYIQTTTADSVAGTYADGRTEKEAIFTAPLPPSPVVAGTPTGLAFPVRDTRGAANAGAGAFIISSQDDDRSPIATGGQKRIVRMIDPPAIALDTAHPVTGSPLASIAGSNDFEVFLVGFSSDYDENFTVVGSATWKATYGTYTAAGGWTNASAAVTSSGAAMTISSPAKQGESTNVERCPPNFVDNLLMDAR